MRMIGVSQDGIEKAFKGNHADKDGTRNIPDKHLVKLCRDDQLEQLSPGKRLERLLTSSTEPIKLHLLEIVRKETAKAFNGDDVDVSCLIDVALCPRLKSVWDETIRLTAFAASVRFLTCDVELGGKTLRKGNRLIMPQRQLHFSQDAFGSNAHEFDLERFIRNPALLRHPSFRPFGGCATMCPGRNLAKRTTLAFVAMALKRFDITLDPPEQPFPAPAEGKPSIGLVDVEVRSDLQVRLQVRK
ncbi:cytochrome P450 [Ustulina deusta]|nr:cytochrome P450 [Ustulina deusta]